MHSDEIKYKIVEASGDIEIRDYEPLALAEVRLPGQQRLALAEAYGILAGYVSGNNTPGGGKHELVGEVIPMVPPVIALKADDTWKVLFVMPGRYTREMLPEPEDERVKLLELPRQRMAAIRFGKVDDEREFDRKAAQLSSYLQRKGLASSGGPIIAYYNSPFTPPEKRRHEVLVFLGKTG